MRGDDVDTRELTDALGMIETWAPQYLPGGWSNYSILLTFLLLVFVLAVRPFGLFGRAA